jgi:putative MATE family efflux protein
LNTARSEAELAREVVRLAWPAIAQSLLQTLVFLVDRAMLGHHGSISLASMQISGPYVWTVTGVMGALSIGAVAVVGRDVGRGGSTAPAAARGALAAACALGVVGAIVAMFTLDAVLSTFESAGPNVIAAAHGYLGVALPALPLFLIASMAAAIHQAAGDTRTPLVVTALINVLHLGLGAVLVFGYFGVPSLGARGAGIASVVSVGIEAVLLIASLLQRDRAITIRGRGGELDALIRMARVASPVVLERLAIHAGYFGYVWMIAALGAVAMAGNQTLVSIESVCFLSADGFGIAAAAIVAQQLGASRPDAARSAALLAMRMSIALLASAGIGFATMPELLTHLFSPDPAVASLAAPSLIVTACAQPFMASATVLGEAMRGAGATRSTLAVSLVCGVGVRLAVTAFASFTLDLGLTGVWIGSTVDWMMRTLLFGVLFARGHWQRTKV